MTFVNDRLEIGGSHRQCEVDEIAFRCVAATEEDEDGVLVNGVNWLRFLVAVRRRSFKLYVYVLPDRFVKGAGQGGGGALAVKEVIAALRLNSDNPVLKRGSIVHSDSAKAYRRLGPLHHPPLGALQNSEVWRGREMFRRHGYVHTACLHKRKAGQRVAYAPARRVTCWDGLTKNVVGGTQYVDGFWRFLRKEVSRQAVSTGKAKRAATRQLLLILVRVAQWRWWYLDANRFELYASYLRAARAR